MSATITAKCSDRVATVSGAAPAAHVIFGCVHDDGHFQVSYSKPSRHYKTPAGADRAARKWCAPTPAEKAEWIARAIAAGDKSAAAILDALHGCGPSAWLLLDSKPGVVSVPRGQWHPFLRQVRNSRPDIFDRINA